MPPPPGAARTSTVPPPSRRILLTFRDPSATTFPASDATVTPDASCTWSSPEFVAEPPISTVAAERLLRTSTTSVDDDASSSLSAATCSMPPPSSRTGASPVNTTSFPAPIRTDGFALPRSLIGPWANSEPSRVEMLFGWEISPALSAWKVMAGRCTSVEPVSDVPPSIWRPPPPWITSSGRALRSISARSAPDVCWSPSERSVRKRPPSIVRSGSVAPASSSNVPVAKMSSRASRVMALLVPSISDSNMTKVELSSPASGSELSSSDRSTSPTSVVPPSLSPLSSSNGSCGSESSPSSLPPRISMWSGSNRTLPSSPAGAPTSTRERDVSRLFPETSTKPPSPPDGPPRAVMRPSTSVLPSDQTITSPPSPSTVASAATVDPAETSVLSAVGKSPDVAPRSGPPTRTTPPPSLPEASRVASTRPMLPGPPTSIRPPPPSVPTARYSPAISAASPAVIRMAPPVLPDTSTRVSRPAVNAAPTSRVTSPPGVPSPDASTTAPLARRSASARMSTSPPPSAAEARISPVCSTFPSGAATWTSSPRTVPSCFTASE